jgi:hypothetical protein
MGADIVMESMALTMPDQVTSWIVASLDRKRLGQAVLWKAKYIRGVFDKETRRKPLAFAADALSYGV